MSQSGRSKRVRRIREAPAGVSPTSPREPPLRVCLLGLGGGGFQLEIQKVLEATRRPLDLILIFSGPKGGIIDLDRFAGFKTAYLVRSPSLVGDTVWIKAAYVAVNVWLAFRILLAERPDLILAAGTAQAIPFGIAGKVLGVPLWFVESCTRVQSPSRTGRWISRLGLSTRLYYCWPELAVHFRQGTCTQEAWQ